MMIILFGAFMYTICMCISILVCIVPYDWIIWCCWRNKLVNFVVIYFKLGWPIRCLSIAFGRIDWGDGCFWSLQAYTVFTSVIICLGNLMCVQLLFWRPSIQYIIIKDANGDLVLWFACAVVDPTLVSVMFVLLPWANSIRFLSYAIVCFVAFLQ